MRKNKGTSSMKRPLVAPMPKGMRSQVSKAANRLGKSMDKSFSILAPKKATKARKKSPRRGK